MIQSGAATMLWRVVGGVAILTLVAGIAAADPATASVPVSAAPTVEKPPAAETQPATEKAPEAEPVKVGPWTGPQGDFREVDGRIMGPWWQGGGPGVVYFTGPDAQRHKSFIKVGQEVAARMGRAYLEIHKEHLQTSEADRNGILVYPDGTARVRLFIMPGGNSFFCMSDVAGISERTPEKAKAERAKFVEARKIPQAAFKTGMNYVGCCGGFFTATSGYDVKGALYTGWGLWPGKVKNIGPGKRTPFPDVVFDAAQAEHPLYKATNGGVLKGMYYNGGPIGVLPGIADTEYFGKYQGGALTELAGDWFLVSYQPKDDLLCGRCVIVTGHPEVYHADFLMAMAEYAVDRQYQVPRRPIEPSKPLEGVSGDDQMQYYWLTVEAGRKLTATLTGLDENCDLYLRAGLPPTFKNHDLKSTGEKTADERLTVAATKAGVYFLGVHGNHTVLNGARYTLTVSVE